MRNRESMSGLSKGKDKLGYRRIRVKMYDCYVRYPVHTKKQLIARASTTTYRLIDVASPSCFLGSKPAATLHLLTLHPLEYSA